MKPLAIGVLLLFTTFLIAGDYTKGCDNYHCSDYYWNHGMHRFDPYTIQWPLHHTGEIYKDVGDGGNHHVYIVYYDHHYKKHTAPLKEFRKMPYCPDPYFLKEGIPMEYYFECEEGYTTKPHWKDAKCSMIGKSHEDFEVYVDGPACSKIIRDWVLIDWCKYEPNHHADNGDDHYVLVYDMTTYKTYFSYKYHGGVKHDGYYKFRQVIKILDTTEPELEDCSDLVYDLKGECKGHVKLKNRVLDEGLCYGQKMEVKLEVFNMYGDLVSQEWLKTKNKEEFWISAGYLHPGKYHLKWKVTDGCKNKSTCTQYLEVVDNSQPSLLCIRNISSSISDEYGMSIWAKDFVVKATDPCGYDSDITFSFEPDRHIPSITFDCSDDFGFHDLTVYATASNGVQNSCEVELFLSDHFACSDQMQIAGLLFNRNEEPLPGVEVDVMQSSNLVASSTSNYLGRYVVNSIPTSKSVEYIEPHIYENPKQGLDAYDLIRMLRHITGVQRFKHVLDYAAADVNDDGEVDMNDYWDLATVIFELPHRSVSMRPWKFIDNKLYRAGIVKASQLTAPIAVRTFRHRYDMLGLKNGDVDFSWSPKAKAKKRTAGVYAVAETANGLLRLKMDETMEANGLTLSIDAKYVNSVAGAHSDLWKVREELNAVGPDMAQIVLIAAENRLLNRGEVILELPVNDQLDATKALSGELFILEGSEATSRPLIIANSASDRLVVEDLGVYPNPFTDEFSIRFNGLQSGAALLTLFDVHGKKVVSQRFENTSDAAIFKLELSGEINSGIYLLVVEGDGGKWSKTVVKQ